MDYTKIYTASSLAQAFSQAGIQAGMSILMHSSFKALGGWVCGGEEALIEALLKVLTPDGTLMMPTHTNNNTDPQYWQHPPVPAEWWQIIRDETPAFDPATTPTRMMGTIPEYFRRYPNVKRSYHPMGSFASWGKHTDYLLKEQPLEAMFGEQSPLARFAEIGGYVFLFGIGHENNTLLHLAEHRAQFKKVMISESSAILVDGHRQWVTYTMIDYDDDDFPRIGADYESNHHPFILGKVGEATTRLIPARALLDYGTWWMSQNRT
jgi:aminoglycoside 3-N-acetyltransferase